MSDLESQDDLEELHSEESRDVEVNRDLFKDDNGFHIAFFFHKSIKKFSRRNLTLNIERHGGIVLDTDIGCDTVLVDKNHVMDDEKRILQNSYNSDDDPRLRKVFVEFASFVQRCIRNDHFVHRIPDLKGMGGYVGNRVSFTESDDENLCRYLARVLPDKAAGGRKGLSVYEMLVKMAEVRDTHAWGARHTGNSWKERYKKNEEKFDEQIEDIVQLEGRSRKQLWPQDRRACRRFRRGKHKFDPLEESSEEDEEERPQPSRKRQRSDGMWPPPGRRVVHLPSDKKGKARAEEDEEESDQSYQSRDYVNEDEPGPSRSRRSLKAATVAADDLTHRTQPNTASFFTQQTIVASAPSGRRVQLKEASHHLSAAESSSLVRPPTQVNRGAKQASSSGHEPLAVIDLTLPSRSNSPVIQQSPTRTLVNPTQTQAAQPSTYKRPLMAARRPRAMIEAAVADAPYRNTRSRSRSVEPNTSNSSVRVSKKGGTKGKQKAMPELATVDEIPDDRQGSENLEVGNESVPPPAGEILAEVQVEKMLVDSEDEDEEPGDTNQVRGVSLDTDDAQTEQNLRATQAPRQTIPSEFLKGWMSRPAAPVRNTQKNSFSHPSPSLSHNVSKAAEPPRTPRKNSASSTEPFPVSGTRASALKIKLQQQEKRSPYNPPSGTRAALFARSRI